MKKILVALTTLALAGAGLIAVASPAAAHNSDLTGSVGCEYVKEVKTGNYVFTWNLRDDGQWLGTAVASGAITDTTPQSLPASWSAVFPDGTSRSLSATITWADGFSGNRYYSKSLSSELNCDAPTPEPTPTPTPEPTPTPTPDPTPVPSPEPPKDFCPDLAGLQWENYDCLTPTATPEPPVVEVPVVEAPVVVAPVEEAVVAPQKPKPATVAVPDAATVPNAVPAGDGSSQDSINWFAIAILTAATVVGAFALRKWNN